MSKPAIIYILSTIAAFIIGFVTNDANYILVGAIASCNIFFTFLLFLRYLKIKGKVLNRLAYGEQIPMNRLNRYKHSAIWPVAIPSVITSVILILLAYIVQTH